ncbi:ribosome maturation factor RimP [Actinomyces sp. zg-332]|uniref:ribosome maturation factor RimP n=1 Tax=Actinomyces sp. zg-332 TaxID=2708340 RepID=UPI00142269F3|nr:ribosome maturation factor RimP [Actinomyces sp. zg-332]QPK93936.1 ribosome maturation factor RimP [Actinomyces sp. zg-332]
MSVQAQVQECLEPLVAENGLFLEKVVLAKSGKNTLVRVVIDLIDTPGGVSSDKIVEISRKISKLLDEKDPIKGAYTLEVTTAGAERDITDLRLWKRAVGRHVKYSYEEQIIEGKVQRVLDDKVVVISVKDSEQEYEIEKIQKARTIIVF